MTLQTALTVQASLTIPCFQISHLGESPLFPRYERGTVVSTRDYTSQSRHLAYYSTSFLRMSDACCTSRSIEDLEWFLEEDCQAEDAVDR